MRSPISRLQSDIGSSHACGSEIHGFKYSRLFITPLFLQTGKRYSILQPDSWPYSVGPTLLRLKMARKKRPSQYPAGVDWMIENKATASKQAEIGL